LPKEIDKNIIILYMLNKRHLNDFNNELIKTFNTLSIGTKYKVLGSASLKSTLYINDYDIHDYFKSNESDAIDRITQHFKKLFRDTYNDSSKWIVDFKCGVDPNYSEAEDGRKLRWNRHDIQLGYKILRNGHRKYFQDCILDKTIMKIDYVLLLNGQFCELSENYDISLNGQNNQITHIDLKTNLKKDIAKYKKEGNLFKAYKREFSLLKITSKNKHKMSRLINLFNGPLGFLNKIINELLMIMIMCEQTFRPVKIKDLVNNLQIIKQQLSSTNVKSLTDTIDGLHTIKEIRNKIPHVIDYLSKKLNNQLK